MTSDLIESDDDTSTVVGSDEGGVPIFDAVFLPKASTMQFARIENGDVVELSNICSQTKTIFVRPVSHDGEYEALMKLINAKSAPEISPLVALNRDDVVLVKHSNDFTRAVILEVHEAIYTIQLIDHGLQLQVDHSQMRFISAEMFNFKRMVLAVNFQLPHNMSTAENSAVDSFLRKWQYNRFRISCEAAVIAPNVVVDLHRIEGETFSGSIAMEIAHSCLEPRWYVRDLPLKHVNSMNEALWIIDNSHLSKGFICCVTNDDLSIFGNQMERLETYGRTASNEPAYVPDRYELCIVSIIDEELDTPLWYRAQFQHELVNNYAQVGLVDYGTTAVVSMAVIRKFNAEFTYERLSLICKIRAEHVSLDLLDQEQFAIHTTINADNIKPNGDSHEIFISDDYFLTEENFD